MDELCEGDRIGMVRKGETGSLHFFINGLDQGVAATRVPSQIWGVVDLYGMTVKVRRRFHGIFTIHPSTINNLKILCIYLSNSMFLSSKYTIR